MKIKRKQDYKEKRKKIKRQISIFTLMLWIVIISTMIWVTVNSTKKTNALEVEDKNWNISLVMYDRSSDTPNQAITEFTWNAQNKYETKQLCMQINYACTTGKEYKPGEIEITIPGIPMSSYSEWRKEYKYNEFIRNRITIAADSIEDENKKYDFSYSYNTYTNVFTFINNKTIVENEHFEGTIQIVYELNSEFKSKTDLEFIAKMKEKIENTSEVTAMESNVCNFHYTSSKKEYILKNEVSMAPKEIYQKLGDVIEDYYWIVCQFNVKENSQDPIVALGDSDNTVDYNSNCIKEVLPEGCVLYNDKFDKLEPKEGNTYYYLNSKFDNGISSFNKYYIGYPKDKYNEGDNIINTAELFGRYEDEGNVLKLAEDSVSLNLVDFNFEYTGELYAINKTSKTNKIYESSIKSDKGVDYTWLMSAKAFYTDSIMDVEIGDDLIYITRENGGVTKLNDDEYYFNEINIPAFRTYNKFTEKEGDILEGYDYEVQVRYKDSNEYIKYTEGVTQKYTRRVSFPKIGNLVVGVKIVIKNLDKTLFPSVSSEISISANIHTKNCKSGKIYNFNYLQVYKKDNEGNRTLANEVTNNSYKTPSSLRISNYDMEVYGKYIQRGYSDNSIMRGSFELGAYKYRSDMINNVLREKYELEYKIYNVLNIEYYEVNKDCIIKQYDILPEGVSLVSTKEDIINSINSSNSGEIPYNRLKLKNGTLFYTEESIIDYIKENTTVEIDYNYKDSSRTKVSIIYNLNEIDWSYYLENSSKKIEIGTGLKVEIPYDSILEYGTTYKNYVYSMWNNQEYDCGYLKDNGEYDKLASDIDCDGNIEEKLSSSNTILNITHAVSSKQAVIQQIRTDKTNGAFASKTSDASLGSEYTYKLRITTGANSLKDLILYDTLETVYDENGNDVGIGWNGEFLGVDTSYAISKGYAPVVYYSEEKNPGKLTEVSEKWEKLTDDVDKRIVKSICIDLRYKADGSDMELSPNNVVFVLINMQAPNDDTIIKSANNMFSTNWRAVDPLGTVIDNVEGIYSNQINVNIYKKENERKDIIGEKTWDDSWKYESYRPKSIIVKLLQDGIEYMRCEVSKINNWEYEFLDVPIYKNEELEEYEYTIEEEEITSYEAIYDGYNITNKLKTKDIEVKKVWDDNDNEKGLRPEVIKIKLFDGENLIDDEYITQWHDWKCTFYNLPEYREDGSKIEYTVDEEVTKVVEFWYGSEYVYEVNFKTDEEFELYKKSYVKEIVGNTITNKYINPDEKIKITGKKIWEDNENKALKRPENVVLQIKNGEEVISEAVVNESSNWSYEFELAKYDESGNEIKYHIDEKETSEFYEKELTDEYTITNKFVVPDEKIKIEAIKLWEDLEDKYSKRPKSVTLQILNGDEVIAESKVSEKDNWRHEFELPKYDELGNEIEYRVDEKDTDENYEKRISGYTVINKCIYEVEVDTSDINIYAYILISFIAIIGLIVGITFIRNINRSHIN